MQRHRLGVASASQLFKVMGNGGIVLGLEPAAKIGG